MPSDSVEAFLEQLRAATARYRDHSAAVAAGYRWMGPDMPNMGEHWINPRLVMQRPFTPFRPSCLSYVRVGERRVLTGMAYILPVRPGESPPSLPVDVGAWHYHTSTLDEEAFLHTDDHHGTGGDHASDDASGIRLAMMHVWAWVENPDGVFTADNWALSYRRLQRPAPSTVDPHAARALFLLADDGIDFFLNVVRANGSPRRTELETIGDALRQTRRAVRRLVRDTPDGAPLSDRTLRRHWRSTWHRLQAEVRPSLWRSVQPAVLSEPS